MIVDISRGIKVGGFDYTVDLSDKARRDLVADHDNGQCDCLNHTISIVNSLDPVMVSKIFIHEVIEAVNNVYCNDKIEHEKIQPLSFGIHQVCESLGLRFGKGE